MSDLKNAELYANVADLAAFVFITPEISHRIVSAFRLLTFLSSFLLTTLLFILLSNYIGNLFHFTLLPTLAIKTLIYIVFFALFSLILGGFIKVVNIGERKAANLMVLFGITFFVCARALIILTLWNE